MNFTGTQQVIIYHCDCGKTYEVSNDMAGQEILCSRCNKSIVFPGERKTKASRIKAEDEAAFQLRYLWAGAPMLIGGIVLIALGVIPIIYGRFVRGAFYSLLVGLVLMLMGAGALLKFMLGKHVEWE